VNSLEVVVLAAGKGRRMHSSLPKVMHEIAGVPMIRRVVDVAAELSPAHIHVVTSPDQKDSVAACLPASCRFSLQDKPLGTAAALQVALPHVSPSSDLLVLYGDMPLLRPTSLTRLLEARKAGADLAILTAILDDPSAYGRVIRDDKGMPVESVEAADATPEELAVREIHTGVCIASRADFADWLEQIDCDNKQAEFYLTDTVALAAASGKHLEALVLADASEHQGVNDRVQLAQAEAEQQRRFAYQLLAAGVGISAPDHLTLRGELTFGADCRIDTGVVLTGPVQCGNRVQIGPYVVLRDCRIEDDVVIEPFSYIEGCRVRRSARIGPYARLRSGADIGEGVEVGNFVEVTRSTLGKGSRAKHLAYIGDARIGLNCNIGAGLVTCNFDGETKSTTHLGDGVFVGSNSTLVAPLKVGDDAYVAAGSVISDDIEPGEAAVSRARQRNLRAGLLKNAMRKKNQKD